jgi:opacity protein-like surface antigen
MKKVIVFVFALMLVCASAFAAEATSASSSNGSWNIQIVGDLVIPTGDAANGYDMGLGGEAMVGYSLDSNMTLGVLGGYQYLMIKGSPSGYSAAYIPIEAVMKYNFGSGQVKPYGILGVGLALGMFSTPAIDLGPWGTFPATTTTSTDLLLDPGIGVAFNLSDKVDLVLQGKVEMIMSSGSMGLYIPLQVGVNFGLN